MSNHCASCGKADANLKACTACMMVKYCGVECQRAHRSAHKKACKKRAAELFDVKLFSQPQQREECPICMVTLPCDETKLTYNSCCGKIICDGCCFCLTRNQCPFCNTASPRTHEEVVERLSKKIEKYNDPEAMDYLGRCYLMGEGSPVDRSKAFELFQRAGELGSASAHFSLGNSYEKGEGTEIDMKKAIHHYQIAAMMGDAGARHNLGSAELINRNYQRAMKHFVISAKCGLKISLDIVKLGFADGHVTKEEFEKTLRGYQASCDETKSEQRDRAAEIRARKREYTCSNSYR
eukprot:scaffold72399_cov49-Cyclotella_meneghiniana.AAC.9